MHVEKSASDIEQLTYVSIICIAVSKHAKLQKMQKSGYASTVYRLLACNKKTIY